MRRILLLPCLAFFAAVLAADDDQKSTKCIHGINPATMSCCLSRNFYQNINVDKIRECFKLPQSLNSCDREICIANKIGFASTDGKIDKNELRNHIEDDFKEDIELKNAIIDVCVEGDIEKYGTEDICEVKKYRLCIELQFLSLCSDWNTKGFCAGAQEIAEECIELYS